MPIREALRTVISTLFRLFPLSVEPGLRCFGHPDEKSPVLATANFDLTVKRVTRYLRGLDCYLLVAPTGGINVWCAAKGGNFTAHSLISVIKTSRISDRVSRRKLILPQLAAPGIDTGLVKRATGWSCTFGPVYARDIPEYLASGLVKTERMRRVRWSLADRLDVGIGVTFPGLLAILIIMAIFFRDWLIEFVLMGLGLTVLMYGLYPFLPGKTAWHKLLFLESLVGLGFLGYVFLGPGQMSYVHGLFVMALALLALIGIDLGGAGPLERSWLDPWLDRLGLRRLGPVEFRGRAKIRGAEITLDRNRCTDCGLCYEVCPREVFGIQDRGRRRVVIENPALCEACEACVRQCPEEALKLSR